MGLDNALLFFQLVFGRNLASTFPNIFGKGYISSESTLLPSFFHCEVRGKQTASPVGLAACRQYLLDCG